MNSGFEISLLCTHTHRQPQLLPQGRGHSCPVLSLCGWGCRSPEFLQTKPQLVSGDRDSLSAHTWNTHAHTHFVKTNNLFSWKEQSTKREHERILQYLGKCWTGIWASCVSGSGALRRTYDKRGEDVTKMFHPNTLYCTFPTSGKINITCSSDVLNPQHVSYWFMSINTDSDFSSCNMYTLHISNANLINPTHFK